jgi:5-methylcytosine-specific restriction endonuclease McrA
MKLCTVCGHLASQGSRCLKHPRTSGIGSSRAVHTDPRWTRLSRREIARHVGQYGWVCPGDGTEHPAHPTTPGTLTLDHVIPVSEGGEPFDRANTRVLCRSRNSELGARLVNARRSA